MSASPGPISVPDPRRRVGIALAVVGTLLFSLKPVLIKLAYAEHAAADTVLALRMLFSLPVYLVIGGIALRRKGSRVAPRDIAMAGLVGVFGYYLASYFDLLGLERISAQLERLILFSYPTLVVAATAVLARRMPGGRTLLALGVAYAGLNLLFGRDLRIGGVETAVGAAFVFAATATFAGYLIASRPVIARLGSLLFTSVAMIAASAAIVAHVTVLKGLPGFAATGTAVWLILAIAIFSTVLPSFMISEAIARLGPAPTSIVGGIGPVVTSVAAVFVLGEAFTMFHLGGLTLAITGIVLLTAGPEAR